MALLERLEVEQAHLTASERQIAQYLISHYPQAILGSASSIGRATKISAATVVRFFAKLGYESFAEAQEEIRREVALKLNSPIDRIAIVDTNATSTEAFLARFHALEVDNIKATFQQIDTSNFEALIACILATKGKIYILGEKNSHPVAFLMWAHLNICLDNVVLVDTGEAMVADRLLWAGAGDLSICVSVRRYSPNGLLAAQYSSLNRCRRGGFDRQRAVAAHAPCHVPVAGSDRQRVGVRFLHCDDERRRRYRRRCGVSAEE